MLALPPLYLHYFDRRLYSNYADKDGFIQQTTGFTCAAASASMLLKHYGFRASEGLIAEEAGTNPLTGTNEFSLARALDNVIASHGYKAAAGCLTYHQAVEMHSPFEAYIVRPPIGGHAILVTSLGLDGVAISDPLIMGSDKMTVAEFKNQWTGTAIWISAQK
jgi:ABC-type bacteriocin/lantibiotic exporter with double-glycine peptidase domain